jgi:hypothetical protein
VAAVSGGVKAEVTEAGAPDLDVLKRAAVLLRLLCRRRARLRRGTGGGGGLDQGVRLRTAGGRLPAETRVARRRRRVRARHAAGDRASRRDPGRVLDAATPSPPHRPIRSWVRLAYPLLLMFVLSKCLSSH